MRHPLLSRFSLCLMLALGGCQASLPPLPAWQSSEGLTHAELGHIIDLASGQAISPEQLVQRLAGAPRVLVGEKHDNPDHHANSNRWSTRFRGSPCRQTCPKRWPGRTVGIGNCTGR